MPPLPNPVAVCLELTRAISNAPTVVEIYSAALAALEQGLGVTRASILLFDPDGVMRFKAWRGLSDTYRAAVEGHTPWTRDSVDPQPILVPDVSLDPSLRDYAAVIAAEGIAAMGFIPLVSQGRVLGKFMVYDGTARQFTADDVQLAGVIAAQVAFAVDRTRAEELVRRSEERLRFALDAAAMGTWDWDLGTETVQWSDNLARIHGLPDDAFDGTFASYAREVHPEDRDRVFESIRRALEEGAPHDIEYRLVAPDGTIRSAEGKGRVESENGKPVRMTGVCMIVTRRKEAELARLAAAEEASRLKDDFLATLSHELRTPLNAILGWVQMLQSDSLAPARAKQAIDVIGRNARLQAQLIEDILDVSRIITGKLEIERVPTLLPALLDIAISGAVPAATARGIQIDHDVSADLPPIECDPKRLQQVLGNILSNALKFTPDGGRITVTCRREGAMIAISVRDSGAGIAPAFLPFVFDRFRQADGRTTRRHGGLGLGLAIARHLVEEHGGRIAAASEGEGRGTTITITLPAGPLAAALDAADGSVFSAGAPLPSDDGAASLVPASTTSEDAAPEVAAATAPSAALVPSRIARARVLVVDDEPDSRQMLAALVERHRAEVLQCASAAAALALLETTPVDLLITDIAMPEMDGYELMARVRRSGQTMPAVAVSAYSRPEDRSRALAAGFSSYCAKPVEAVAFLHVLEMVLAGSLQ